MTVALPVCSHEVQNMERLTNERGTLGYGYEDSQLSLSAHFATLMSPVHIHRFAVRFLVDLKAWK
jgi:hypothetical protein